MAVEARVERPRFEIIKGGVEIPDQVSGDGKSFIRRIVDPYALRLMKSLHHLVPAITPDNLTDLSAGVQLFLTFVQEEAHIANHKLSTKEMGALGTFKAVVYSGDKFDGSMADIYDTEEPGKHDRGEGNRRDAKRDRQREGGSALLRARTEYLKGSIYGEMFAYFNAFTAAEPSKERARFEEKFGLKPPEWGENPLEALGTSMYRILFTELAGLRSVKGVYIRPWVDLTSGLANLYTAHKRRLFYERYKDTVGPIKEDEPERIQISKDAALRLADIEEVQRNIIKASAATFIALRVGSFLQPEIAQRKR